MQHAPLSCLSSISARISRRPARLVCCFSFAVVALILAGAAASADGQRFLPRISVSSTIPANGDVNPYGVAIVPSGFPTGGPLMTGDVLVSNFNNAAGLQGTGTTIIKFTPNGPVAPPDQAQVFFQAPTPGLTTALGVLKRGFVIVGSVSTTDGTFSTIEPGPLTFLDRNGNVIAPSPFTTMLDGPWDLTIFDQGSTAKVFVSNVLNGTVTRLDLNITSTSVTVAHTTVIASGYNVQPNDAALVLGPTGLAYDPGSDTLFVASTGDNMVFSVPQAGSRTNSAGKGAVVFNDEHLRGPLALRFAPNGHLVTANGDAVNADPTQPSEMVEFTITGKFVGQSNVDASQGGAFGFDVANMREGGSRLAAVDDVANSITVNDRGQLQNQQDIAGGN